ncbi:MAG: tRNA (adenosine(37)-N6)-dimethylallyltransferase MiaA, partial [Brevinematia bacterium]
ANLEIREKLYKVAQEKGKEFLYLSLARIDPEYSRKISRNDLKRIIRALEVYEVTGKPFSKLQEENTKPSPFKIFSFLVLPNRRELYSAINERVDKMLKRGLVEEVRWITSRYGRNIYPLSSIGYREVCEYLDGKVSYEKMVELIKKNTRNLAKRQITLFRNTEIDEILELNSLSVDDLNRAVSMILRRFHLKV